MIEKTNIIIQSKLTKKIKYYFELDNGYWCKQEYNSRGNETYFEVSDGWWYKKGFEDKGKITYYENSGGYIRDDRKK